MGKTIGILGGMGPEATAYFFELIIRGTQASKDQEHVPVIIHSDPRVPPRTEAIRGRGESPVPFLRRGAAALEKAGADFLVMPCITAHHFLDDIRTAVRIPFVDLLEEAASDTSARFGGLRRAGLLGSPGTVNSRIVHRAFARRGLEVMVPGPEEQARVTEAIFGRAGVKAGFRGDAVRQALVEAAGALIARGAETVIAGCTEVPLALSAADLEVPFIEPMEIGARACIRLAGFNLRGELPG
jgi:aspartate racemase